MSLRYACFTDESSYLKKAKLLVLGLLSPSARLSGFQNYWTSEIKGMLLYFVYLGCDIEENLVPYPFAVISKCIYRTLYFHQVKQAD
jgi:hypothetical protein